MARWFWVFPQVSGLFCVLLLILLGCPLWPESRSTGACRRKPGDDHGIALTVLGGALTPLGAAALAESRLGYAGVAGLMMATAVVSIGAVLALRQPARNTFAVPNG